ncbi:low temperature requirement protein A [Micromonospora sp. NPDC048930]|uniref:low temperature requirement protein A n=1 Tax=Micromonospora sp. NPDC048930 TaxID=3364261 RepID=UPI0037193A91
MGGVGRIQLAGAESGVSRLELFLDLIFVFTFLNVTGVTAEQLNPAGLPRGLLLLVLLWRCWAPFAWLGNIVRLDRGVMPVVMFGLSATLFVMGLTVREAFLDRPGGLSGPVVFALCYLVVRTTVLAVATLAGEEDHRRRLRPAWPSMLAGALFLLAAAVVPDSIEDPVAREWVRFALIAGTVVVEYGGAMLLGSERWRIGSIQYWAERHSLILLIGFGETIISVGLSQGVAVAQPLTPAVLVGVLLGVGLAGALWWTYFDVARFAAEQALERVAGERRTRLGRDAYSLLHLPMMAGLILVALGLKKALGDLRVPADSETTAPGFELLVLYGGVALYLLGLILFEIRTLRFLGRSPVLGIVLVVAFAPVAPHLPVLAQLALLAGAAGAMALADATVFGRRHRRLHAQIAHAHEQVGVTPKELFFDLVFVYAFLQVAALMSDDPSWTGLARGLLVLTVLWLAWAGYSWLAVMVRSEHPAVRLVMVLVVALTTLITLASPQAFTDALGGLEGPLVFVACYAVIRLLRLVSLRMVGRRVPAAPMPQLRDAAPTLLALALLVAAALVPQPSGDIRQLAPVRAALWLLAIAVDVVGNARIGLRNLWVGSAEHWADRYGLIIIIGLGEAVISMGSAVVYTPISARIVVAVFLGTALLASLWWVYFGWDSAEGERILVAAQGRRRTRLARDAYAWLHLPMVAGIVLVSLGLRKTMSVLGSRGFFEFGAPPYLVGHVALFGGVLLYLVGDLAFRWRLAKRVRPARIAQALVVAALLPLTTSLAALLALGVLAAACLSFTAFEVARGHKRAGVSPVTSR